jgi:hypothetical protein
MAKPDKVRLKAKVAFWREWFTDFNFTAGS